MSGGSYNYACFKVEGSEIFSALNDVRGIENYLRSLNLHKEADEVLLFIKEVETHQLRLAIIGQRISPLLMATEWEASGDRSVEGITDAYWKLMGIEIPERAK